MVRGPLPNRVWSARILVLVASLFLSATHRVKAETPFVIETVTGMTTVTDGWRSRSLALDPEGEPGIAYSDRPLPFWVGKYADREGSGWSVQVFDTAAARDGDVSLAFDAQGNPHVSYRNAWLVAKLNYAHRTDGGWAVETVHETISGTGEFSSIQVDAGGMPCIAYTYVVEDQYGDYQSNLYYARKTATAWERQPVDDRFWVLASAGMHCDLALDSNGVPNISYRTFKSGVYADLTFAKRSGAGWQIEVVDSPVGFSSTSIELDAQANPHICYRHSSTGDLRHARKTGGSWLIETVIPGPNALNSFSSLELDVWGNPHVSVSESGTGDLFYARKYNGVWAVEVADASPTSLAKQTSIALLSGRTPMIAYRDDTPGLLKLARGLHPRVALPEGELRMLGDDNHDADRATLLVRPTITCDGLVEILCRGFTSSSAPEVAIFDLSGRRVRAVRADTRSADGLVTTWDGTDHVGGRVAAGAYFLRVTSATGSPIVERVTIVR